MPYPTRAQLDAGVPDVEGSPKDHGTLEMVVRRPAEDQREVLEEGELDPAVGLIGDSWLVRAGESPDANRQLNIMNARAVALVSGSRERWPLAGDQLYVDFDIGVENAPPGTQLEVGEAVIEVTDIPHRGCKKFSARFGSDAWRWVNDPVGRTLNLRGVNARVVRPGRVAPGDRVSKRGPA